MKLLRKLKRFIVVLVSCILLVIGVASMTSCSVAKVEAEDLTKGIKAETVECKNVDEVH